VRKREHIISQNNIQSYHIGNDKQAKKIGRDKKREKDTDTGNINRYTKRTKTPLKQNEKATNFDP
jgi:hypothetical protein